MSLDSVIKLAIPGKVTGLCMALLVGILKWQPVR